MTRSENEGTSDAIWSHPHHGLHCRRHWPRRAEPCQRELAPELGALVALHGDVETVGYWRRYYQQYRYGPGPYAVPPVVVPAPVVVPPAVVETPVVPPPPPPRPASCGEYRYWNGEYCVDARYNRTYVGPRP